MAMLCHLLGIFTSFVGPLIIWLIKKDQSRFVDYHGREVLNFKINLIGIIFIVFALAMIISLVTCGFGAILVLPLYMAPMIYALVLLIIGAQKANRGELYQFPLTIRIIPLPVGTEEVHQAGSYEEEGREVVTASAPASQSSPWPMILLIGGGAVGVLTLTACGGCFYLGYQAKQEAKKSLEKSLEDFQAQANKQAKGFAPPPGMNDPFAALNAPANLDEALAALRSGEVPRQLLAANWLAKTNVDPARQAEIAQALQPLLNDADKNVQTAAMKALVSWATPENVPAIIAVVQNDEFGLQTNEMRHLAMETLARLKDPRGAAPVAQRLTNIHDRSHASKTLQAMGPIAESEVAKLLAERDAGVRIEACKILRVIGTKASIADLETASRDKNRNVANAAKSALSAVRMRGG
jgi:hypothetical protein